MKSLSLLCRTTLLACALAAPLFAEPDPHPTRADRLVDERDGFTVEYSAGQETYVEAVFAAVPSFHESVKAWTDKIENEGERRVPPGGAKDLLAHRNKILRSVAAEVGLVEPTRLQGQVFDTMLRYYALIDLAGDQTPLLGSKVMECSAVQIWDKAELARRLSGGELLNGFSWDAAANQVNYRMNVPEFEVPLTEEAAANDFEVLRLDHAFNYRPVGDGVVVFSASFSFDKEAKPQPLRPPEGEIRWDDYVQKARERIRVLDAPVFPLILSERTNGMSPTEVARDCFSSLLDPLAIFGGDSASYRNPLLLQTILHEAVEVGLVENYIGSADRRWLCDGVANYVAWKIVRDRCGAEVAKQAFDLDSQLAMYAKFQKQIDLRRWLAVENTKEEDRDTDLTKAHYAFATRAVFEIVRQNGEDFLPKLFREVAKTPRNKVRMSTVEKAYRKLTGKKLADVIKAAETTPVPGLKS